MKHYLRTFLPLLLYGVGTFSSAQAQLILDLEGGGAFKGPYNDVRIPSSGGTEFNAFGLDFEVKAVPYFRGKIGYLFNDRHSVFVTAAPLKLDAQARSTLSTPIQFNGVSFSPNPDLRTRYLFNTYRLTYRYDFVRRERLRFGAGVSGLVRQAQIRLQQGERTTAYDNLGVVPLLNVYLNWLPTQRLGVVLEGDGLARPPFDQGRAFDFFGGVNYLIRPSLAVKVGYRILEGGANTDDIYNFSLINFGTLGLTYHFSARGAGWR
ncbi:hypothetical protein GCM10027275_36120 [Rhabdobacter roseus]|uniref:Outer membrane protein beta-barrel domain-containing protein n=1 Tax=Rhabdobacter roseus TaxID=1655419 RepID=A0A840TWL6_9BACT|nr:hypothetical protein [Rhabdobacter roseus]MBB5285982.1 hypothetical protein [Rhabdobacter roseus]